MGRTSSNNRKKRDATVLLVGTLGEQWTEEWAACLDKRSEPDSPVKPASPDEFCWCLDCERVFPVRDIKVYAEREMGELFLQCPAEGCTSGIADFHLWSPNGWIRSAHPEYPKVPTAYKTYPLYG